ncbi:leucine-rich repeat-containing protein 63 isoform X3 [Peromyscus californicus insignis]|uniref:leucine-rich repeat-containing protein 63 isoform X3 n=1 Tax=Peromyscus californicus insignis TaxID=564181 RepID=UPI0022A73F07|nr:leucine-rich repeat-containing protein 63 isoform X3 [Peromyscus californicus insignis]
MRRGDCHSLKAQQQHILLLRRPLPPKLPKLPSCQKKYHTATTSETEQPPVKLPQDESTLVKSDEGVPQAQRPISIQSLCLDHEYKALERAVNILPYPRSWKIPRSAVGSMFIPSCLSASSRVFRKKLRKMKRAKRKSKKKDKRESFFADKSFNNLLVLSTQFTKPVPDSYSRLITSKAKRTSIDSRPVPKTPDYTQELPLLGDVTETLLSPIPSVSSTVPEPQWSERPPHRTATLKKVVLKITALPAFHTLPSPVLPRRPPRQIAIENAAECGKVEAPKPPENAFIGTMRKLDTDAYVLRGEGFKTIAATRYDTIMAMTTLAIINCQIYGRNALSLKGFFLLYCPDLTPLTFQLIYLNLSFNDLSKFPVEIFCLKNLQVLKLRNNPIREIPSEIQQLKLLRIFSIAFNLIRELPLGSLEKLNVDGNYMTSFPPGILKLKLTKLQFDNTFTNSNFWIDYCWNDPQPLSQICSWFIVKNNLHRIPGFIPKKVQKCLRSTSRCDWCHGPKFGEGFRIIRSCDMFGATQIPIMFYVCCSSCYVEIRESSFILEGFPCRRIVLNMDWIKEGRVSDVSFYL